MQFPEILLTFRTNLGLDRVEYGAGGVYLYRVDELPSAQLGYSTSPDGTSLCGSGVGDWRKSWIVIGQDLLLGDPIIAESGTAGMPVLTAMHGEGRWDPDQISSSLEHYRNALIQFASVAEGRDNPVKLEGNPLSAKARKAAVMAICGNDPGADVDYWTGMLSDE
jgi:hypothetical protein